jgi:UDP-N-acetylglucosamine 2-epimerase
MAPADFLRLLCNSRGIIGNSSVGIRECSYLGVPAVNIGTRQLGRERGANVVDVDYDRQAIRAAIQSHLGNGRVPQETLYGDGRAGERIAALLAREPLTIEKRLTYDELRTPDSGVYRPA